MCAYVRKSEKKAHMAIKANMNSVRRSEYYGMSQQRWSFASCFWSHFKVKILLIEDWVVFFSDEEQLQF